MSLKLIVIEKISNVSLSWIIIFLIKNITFSLDFHGSLQSSATFYGL